MRIVCSLAYENDYDKLFQTLSSLQNQVIEFDRIYLGVDSLSDVPDKIKELCVPVVVPRNLSMRCVHAAFLKERNPNTIIITVSEGVVYPKFYCDVFMGKKVKYNVNCVCAAGQIKTTETSYNHKFSGFNIPKCGRKIDIAHRHAGILCVRGDLKEHDMIDDTDYGFSKYLDLLGIDRFIFEGFGPVEYKRSHCDKVFNNEQLNIEETTQFKILIFVLLGIAFVGFIIDMKLSTKHLAASE